MTVTASSVPAIEWHYITLRSAIRYQINIMADKSYGPADRLCPGFEKGCFRKARGYRCLTWAPVQTISLIWAAIERGSVDRWP
jgi:hypothetical protein